MSKRRVVCITVDPAVHDEVKAIMATMQKGNKLSTFSGLLDSLVREWLRGHLASSTEKQKFGLSQTP